MEEKGKPVVVPRWHLRGGAIGPVEQLQQTAVFGLPVTVEVDDQSGDFIAELGVVAVLPNVLSGRHQLRGDLDLAHQRRRRDPLDFRHQSLF